MRLSFEGLAVVGLKTLLFIDAAITLARKISGMDPLKGFGPPIFISGCQGSSFRFLLFFFSSIY